MRLYKPTYRDKRTGETRKQRTWWLEAWQGGRQHRLSLGTRDKTAAQLKAAEVVRRLELEAAGVVDRYGEQRTRPIGGHLDDFEREVFLARNRSEQNRREKMQTLRRFVEEAGVRVLGDLDQSKATRWLQAEADRGLSARSVNKHREGLRQFSRWLVATTPRRAAENPLPSLPRRDQETEREHERRALLPEELARLLDVAPLGRRACYLLAATSGLRRKELRTLRVCDLDLDQAAVTILARRAKNKREETLPLPPQAVELLREHLATRPADGLVFASIPEPDTLYRDLVKAGIPRETEAGVFDFHGLRVTYCTLLERAGVSLRQAQRLMRHSTPTLTSNTYTSLTLRDARGAIEALASVLPQTKHEPGVPALGTRPCGPPCGNPRMVTHNAALTTTEEASTGPGGDPGKPFRGSVLTHAGPNPGWCPARSSKPDPAPASPATARVTEPCPSHLAGDLAGDPSPSRTFPEPGQVARDLLALAPDAPDPGPLLEAARILLEWSRATPAPVLVLPDTLGRTGSSGSSGRDATGSQHSPNGGLPVPERTGSSGSRSGNASAPCTNGRPRGGS